MRKVEWLLDVQKRNKAIKTLSASKSVESVFSFFYKTCKLAMIKENMEGYMWMDLKISR